MMIARSALVALALSAGCTEYAPDATTADSMEHGGGKRTYRVYVPPQYQDGTPLPLVLMLHGGVGTGRQLENTSGMNDVARREGFLVVYPDGLGRTWNAGSCCGRAARDNVDDIGFIKALLDTVAGRLSVDRGRVYMTGMSNGALLSLRMACESPETLAAVGSVAGTVVLETCQPRVPIPLIMIHGEDDGHVRVDGNTGCGPGNANGMAVQEVIDTFSAANGCPTGPTSTTEQHDTGSCQLRSGCAGGSQVALCLLPNAGHEWHGGSFIPDLTVCQGDGPQVDFPTSEVLWRFFSGHRR
jgi:polyhydroxybutyrate depolymerase